MGMFKWWVHLGEYGEFIADALLIVIMVLFHPVIGIYMMVN